jgi:adenine/guanine phosphoribosyltransferase-like PRPP-binding protein
MKSINPFLFLWVLIKTFSIHDTINYFEKESQSTDFYINFIFWRFYVIQTPDKVGDILNAVSYLSFLNANFNTAFGLNNTINNVNNDTHQWRILHRGLKKSVLGLIDGPKKDVFHQKIQMALKILVESDEYHDSESFVHDFMSIVWVDLIMGEDYPEKNVYKELREDILAYITFTFYDNLWKNVPIIGAVTCASRQWSRRYDLYAINDRISMIIDTTTNGFIHNLKMSIEEEHHTYTNAHRKKMLIDNVILSFLVYDFVKMYLHGLVIEYSKLNEQAKDNIYMDVQNDNHKNIMTSDFIRSVLADNFLFPIRGRYLPNGLTFNDNSTTMPNSYYFINLVRSGKFFSSGPRSCVGYPLIKHMTITLLSTLNDDYRMIIAGDSVVVRNPDIDNPHIISKHGLHIYKRDHLHNVITPIRKGDGPQMYDICSIYSDRKLYGYIVDNCIRELQSYAFDAFVSVESRGFPLMGSLARELDIPSFLIRKKGKSIGLTVISTQYSRSHTPDEVCTIEIPNYKELHGKSIAFIDDGLSSGQTTLAAKELLDKMDCKIVCCVYMVQHHYYPLNDKYVDNFGKNTITCFDL